MTSRRSRAVPALLVAAAGALAAARAPWHDPSPHEVRRVAVAPGVALEVLDWGGPTRSERAANGAAAPLVFLPGLGNTAHAFDVFAPRFRDASHVYGITPRGFGASSHPDSGYDSRSRARDILAALDSLGVRRAVLVGHSVAGDEMTRFAVEHPDRVRALVYLDAYSYGPDSTTEPPLPPHAALPRMTAPESASVAGVVAYWARRFGIRPVEAEVRAVSRFAPDGRLELFQAPNASAQVYAGTAPSDYAHVRAPALGVFATHTAVEQVFPGAAHFDAENRRLADAYLAFLQRYYGAQIRRFRAELRCRVVREIPGANHYVHYSNAGDVEGAMRAFLANAAPGTAPACQVPAGDPGA